MNSEEAIRTLEVFLHLMAYKVAWSSLSRCPTSELIKNYVVWVSSIIWTLHIKYSLIAIIRFSVSAISFIHSVIVEHQLTL